MKRKHKRIYDFDITSFFSLFKWRQCCVCKMDFRREMGWRFFAGPSYGTKRREYFVCSSCAPKKDNVVGIIMNRTYLPRRPLAPKQPPPKPQVNNERTCDYDS